MIELRVTINTMSQYITDLQVRNMSPWAELELGEWLRVVPKANDIAIVGKAIEGYVESSCYRSRILMERAQDYHSLVVNTPVAGMPTLSRPTSEHAIDSIGLARQSLSLKRKGVELTITWAINIDDHGEVKSLVSARAKFPDSWKRTIREEGAELDKVGKAFDMLKDQRGVAEAILVTCKTVFLA